MSKGIERVIFDNLLFNEDYSRRVIPFLKEEYFHDPSEKIVFDSIRGFIEKYQTLPTREALLIDIDKKKNIPDDQHKQIVEIIKSAELETKPNDKWILDETEKFCKDKAVYNAIMESIHIIDGKSKKLTQNAIPEILSDALAVSFDTHIGHDFIEDSDGRYEFYNAKEEKVPFDLLYMNEITSGGLPRKTLSICMAGTGVGKSMFMCHHAAACLMQNLNVLYITCEMAEERIAERIDANLMDIPIQDLRVLPKTMYDAKIQNIEKLTKGKLIIKEYPTATANVSHFRNLLSELWLKKKFKPDIIFIDYLNICTSSRIKAGNGVNSYTLVKAIAEEIRGLAIEHNLPIVSATQTNRNGYNSSDVELTDTSESFGLPATADLMFALVSTEELDEQGVVLVKQLKNRLNDGASNRRFLIGIDRAKMKFFDVKENDQTGLIGSNHKEATNVGSGFGDEYDKAPSYDFSDWNLE